MEKQTVLTGCVLVACISFGVSYAHIKGYSPWPFGHNQETVEQPLPAKNSAESEQLTGRLSRQEKQEHTDQKRTQRDQTQQQTHQQNLQDKQEQQRLRLQQEDELIDNLDTLSELHDDEKITN